MAGRRFEAVGANPVAAWATGLPVKLYRAGGYVWAQVLYWLAGVLLAGIINKPTAFQGDGYLLPSVAAVVLGGTSLLGGRGNLVPTAIAAAVPHPARAVRARTGRHVRRPDPGRRQPRSPSASLSTASTGPRYDGASAPLAAARAAATT